MTETLLTTSSIKMYGRVLSDLTYTYDPNTNKTGYNNFLQQQLNANGHKVHFARIYAFSYEGAVYNLPRPSIFLVHDAGKPVTNPASPANRTNVDVAGVAAKDWEFSDGQDLVYWEYEKGDFSLRLDTEAGPLEQILLAAALTDRGGTGQGIRSGANLSGANLSGANLSGANLSGANLSGANLSGRNR
jgi:hypothetical protein